MDTYTTLASFPQINMSNFRCMKFLKTDSVHPVQSHGKLVADNDSGKKRGAIIHAKGPLISECLFDF